MKRWAFRDGGLLLFVRLFVCLSPEMHTTGDGGGLSRRPVELHSLA